jgi:hypothetical protein
MVFVLGLVQQDPGHPELVVLHCGRLSEYLVTWQGRPHLVGAKHIRHGYGMCGGRDVGRSHFAHPGHRTQNHVQLPGEDVQLIVGDGQASQPRKVGNVIAADPAARAGCGSGGFGCVGHDR